MRVAYVNYGSQSGVTASVARELAALGHLVDFVDPTFVLALRDRRTRLPRPTPRVLYSVAASALRFGPQALHHRINTVFSFDQHTRVVGRLLEELPRRPDVVLQNGALFAPGRPSPLPYVLLLDNTCRLAERQPPVPEAQIGKHIEFGDAWIRRERETYLRAHGIATFSHLVRRSLIEDYGIDAAKITVTGAGANLAPYPEPARRDDGRTLLFVGKESFRRKGGPVLLRAFRKLRAERPELRLLLAGPAEPLELPEGAVNLGVVSFERVRELLCEATVFVLPTLREPFGIAYLDAMLCKVPCVGTAVGVVPDTLGRAGVIVPPGDDEALAAAVAELLDDEERRRAMGDLGRQRVIDGGFLWPDVVQKLAGVLESAARARGAGEASTPVSA
jgi:glycosyltransferase involved in cell wall biosynthesis